jgi:hypothetical protein
MSEQRGQVAAESSVRPNRFGLYSVLVLGIVILRLVILLGWRDGGRRTE